MGDRIERVSPVPGKNTVIVQSGAARFEIARTTAVELGLAPGIELAAPLRAALAAAAARRQAAARVLRWLRGRPRTERDVRCFLLDRAYDADVVDSVVAGLRAQGLVDDARFARWFVDARVARRPESFAVLAAALAAQGVPPDVVASALSACRDQHDEMQLALAAARQRLRAVRSVPPARAAARLGRFLAGRGFDADTVRAVCRTCLGDIADADDVGPGQAAWE